MDTLTITIEQAQALESAGIVKFYGISGQPTTAEVAAQAPQLCQMVSNAGDTFNLSFNDKFTAVKA